MIYFDHFFHFFNSSQIFPTTPSTNWYSFSLFSFQKLKLKTNKNPVRQKCKNRAKPHKSFPTPLKQHINNKIQSLFCAGQLFLGPGPALEWDWCTHGHSIGNNWFCLSQQILISNGFLVRDGTLHFPCQCWEFCLVWTSEYLLGAVTVLWVHMCIIPIYFQPSKMDNSLCLGE